MMDQKGYSVRWSAAQRLESSLSLKNRSMELSELVRYEGRLFAFCHSVCRVACDIASALPHEGLKVEDRALDFGPLKSFLQSRTVSEEDMYVRSLPCKATSLASSSKSIQTRRWHFRG